MGNCGNRREQAKALTVRAEDSALIEGAIALGNANRKTLGLLPSQAYKEAAAKGTLIVVEENSRIIAYALYGLPRQIVRLTHLCVSDSARGRGIARLLVNTISERHADRTAIVLKCRSDFTVNNIWPHLGFRNQGEIPGRSSKRLPLTLWRLDHGYPDLLSLDDSIGPLKVLLDLNVFADIEAGWERKGSTESKALTADWLIGQVDLAVSGELLHEIEKLPDGTEKNNQLNAASRYSVLRKDPRVINKMARKIIEIARNTIGIDLTLDPNDVADVRHLAHAYLAGISVVATRDQRFIEWASEITEHTDVRVMRPSAVIAHVDQLADEQKYRPAQLQQTEYILTLINADDSAIEEFLNRSQGERKSIFLDRIFSLVADSQYWVCSILRDPHGNQIALFISGSSENRLEVPILRVTASRIEDTIARQLIFYIRGRARAERLDEIRVTDQHISPTLTHALQDDGFIRHESNWHGFVVQICDIAYAINDRITQTAARAGLHLPSLQPSPSAAVAADLERKFWPVKIKDSGLQNFLVPIQPIWATDLFGVPQSIFPRSNALGISREHIYYRGPHPRGEEAPGRILWYVSGSAKMNGMSAVIGCSRLEEVIIAKPAELHQRFQHLGVWKKEQITAAARSGKALAMRFADTEIFATPVPLQRLRQLAEKYDQALFLQSTKRSARTCSQRSTMKGFLRMGKHDSALLLSVHPPFAESIISGTKTAEVRKQRPSARPGTLIIIYATKPIGAIVGTARLSGISQGSPEEMWSKYQSRVGITRDEYYGYLKNTPTAYILLIERVQQLAPLLTLEKMRESIEFHPPQGYRYVSEYMLHNLVENYQ